MADVFIAYARLDREIAEPLAAALNAAGYTTWHDVYLTPGVDFVHEIREQVRIAKCVVVIWSARSVHSAFARMEAKLALDLNTYVPISVDGEPLPLAFRPIKTLDLEISSAVPTLNAHPNFQRLIDTVERMVGQRAANTSPDESAWALAQAIRTAEAYREFAEQYPSSRFAPEARRRQNEDERGRHGKVFLSYRRDDTQAVARLLYEKIGEKIGRENVFFDVDSIPIGETFDDYIEARLIQSSAVLVIIGETWLGKGKFRSRIKEKSDYVRKEVEMAFREKKRVIPVLVAPHPIPSTSELPKSLHDLPRIQAANLSLGRDYEENAGRIVSAIA